MAWLGLAWLGLAWLGLAWLGLAWLGIQPYAALAVDSSVEILSLGFGHAEIRATLNETYTNNPAIVPVCDAFHIKTKTTNLRPTGVMEIYAQINGRETREVQAFGLNFENQLNTTMLIALERQEELTVKITSGSVSQNLVNSIGFDISCDSCSQLDSMIITVRNIAAGTTIDVAKLRKVRPAIIGAVQAHALNLGCAISDYSLSWEITDTEQRYQRYQVTYEGDEELLHELGLANEFPRFFRNAWVAVKVPSGRTIPLSISAQSDCGETGLPVSIEFQSGQNLGACVTTTEPDETTTTQAPTITTSGAYSIHEKVAAVTAALVFLLANVLR